MRRLIIPVLVAATALVLAGAATGKTIDMSSASGDYAIAQASGTINNPHRIRVRVTAKPRQRVEVSWTMTCGRGTSAASKSGQYKARTTTTRTLRQPMRHADQCVVAANAQLDGSGKVTIRILG